MDRPILKRDKPELSQAVAAQMLSNIFDACECEANVVPMDVLVSYTKYRRERYSLRWIVLALLLLFLMVPVLFITPEVELSELNSNTGKPVLEVKADSWIPIDKVTAEMGEYSLPVYEMRRGVYQIIPDRNGVITVKVVLKNQQYTEKEYQVENVDRDPPVLTGSRHKEDTLELYFQEDGGEIDFEGIYAVSNSGQTVYPISYDKEKLVVIFAYPNKAMNIFVPDEYGNVLQLVLTLF